MLLWLDLQQELPPSQCPLPVGKKSATSPHPKGTLAHENSRKKNNLRGKGGRVPCPFPCEGIRAHPWARGNELQALAASPRSWQRVALWKQSRPAGAPRRLGKGPSARLPCGERSGGEKPATAASSPPVPPAGQRPGTGAAAGKPARTAGAAERWEGAERRAALAGEMAGLHFCPRRSDPESTLLLRSLPNGWTRGGSPGPGCPELFLGGGFSPPP